MNTKQTTLAKAKRSQTVTGLMPGRIPKASKKSGFDAFRVASATLPITISDFVDVANCVPPSMRGAFQSWVPPAQAAVLARNCDWLRSGPLGNLVPSAEAVEAAEQETASLPPFLTTPDEFWPSSGELPHKRLRNWITAVSFVIKTFDQILWLRDVFPKNPFVEPGLPSFGGKPIVSWSPPWPGELMVLTPAGQIAFRRIEHPITDFYVNFLAALKKCDYRKLNLCDVERREGVCGRYYYKKHPDQNACCPQHAQSRRSKNSYRKKHPQS